MRLRHAAPLLCATLLACSHSESPAPKPVADAAALESSAGRCGIARFEELATAKLNAYRNAGARCRGAGNFASAAPLTWNPRLARAALLHTQEMAQTQSLEHIGRDGREPSARADAAGYRSSSTRENIATGATSLEAVMAMWMTSPGHCANMLAPELRDFGLACVARNGGQPYWTLLLARSE